MVSHSEEQAGEPSSKFGGRCSCIPEPCALECQNINQTSGIRVLSWLYYISSVYAKVNRCFNPSFVSGKSRGIDKFGHRLKEADNLSSRGSLMGRNLIWGLIQHVRHRKTYVRRKMTLQTDANGLHNGNICRRKAILLRQDILGQSQLMPRT